MTLDEAIEQMAKLAGLEKQLIATADGSHAEFQANNAIINATQSVAFVGILSAMQQAQATIAEQGNIIVTQEFECDALHDIRNEHEATIATQAAEIERLKAVVDNIIAIVKDSPMGMVVTDKKDDWNPDAHIEITLTVADVYAALAAREGK